MRCGPRCETGVSDGEWIEVTNRRVPGSEAASTGDDPWTPIDGTEQVILGDLSILTDGAPVEVAPATKGTKLASETPAPDHRPADTAPAPWRRRTNRSGGRRTPCNVPGRVGQVGRTICWTFQYPCRKMKSRSLTER